MNVGFLNKLEFADVFVDPWGNGHAKCQLWSPGKVVLVPQDLTGRENMLTTAIFVDRFQMLRSMCGGYVYI